MDQIGTLIIGIAIGLLAAPLIGVLGVLIEDRRYRHRGPVVLPRPQPPCDCPMCGMPRATPAPCEICGWPRVPAPVTED